MTPRRFTLAEIVPGLTAAGVALRRRGAGWVAPCPLCRTGADRPTGDGTGDQPHGRPRPTPTWSRSAGSGSDADPLPPTVRWLTVEAARGADFRPNLPGGAAGVVLYRFDREGDDLDRPALVQAEALDATGGRIPLVGGGGRTLAPSAAQIGYITRWAFARL